MNLNKKTIYLLTDVESTGTDYIHDQVFDIAFIITDGVNINKTYSSLIKINSEAVIDKAQKEIGHIVNINKEKIMKARSMKEVMTEVIEMIVNLNHEYHVKLVAHNITFDYHMIMFSLQKICEQYKTTFIEIFPKEKLLDTKELAKHFFPGLSSYSLTNACLSLKIASSMIEDREINKHSALLDTQILFELFKRIKKEAQFFNI